MSKRQDKAKPHGKNNSVLIARTVSSDETKGVMHARLDEENSVGLKPSQLPAGRTSMQRSQCAEEKGDQEAGMMKPWEFRHTW